MRDKLTQYLMAAVKHVPNEWPILHAELTLWFINGGSRDRVALPFLTNDKS